MTREVHVAGGEFAELSGAILRRGRSIRFRARGRSMLPLIRNGDVVIAQPASDDDLCVGSVVLHRIGPDRLVAHRIVWRGLNDGAISVKTRGDASFGPPDVVGAEQVLGRVVAVQRGDRLVRLDRGGWRLAGTLWARLWPTGPILLRLLRGAARLCRKMGLRRGGPQAPPARTLDSPQVGN